MKNIMNNWKTSSAGIAMILTGVVHLVFQLKAHSLSETDCTATMLAILGGVGLIYAGDASAPPPPPKP